MRGSAVFRTGIAPGGALAGPWVRNPLWTAARAVPSLDLRFADNKSLVDAVTGASLVTFTRASSGTFVGSDGVLRTAVTNLVLRSEEFETASWQLFGTTSRTANTTVAPNGTITADSVTLPASSGIFQIVNGLANTAYTFSIWIRCDTTQSVRLVINTNLSDPTTLTVTATSTWQRFNITKTTSVGTTTVTSQVDTGGGNTFFLWGAQLEQSSTVGEYIPTTSTINSAPRFDHNPTTGESLGLLVEEARTNSIRNNTMVGAVAGTPGSTPTNWAASTTNAELTSQIIGVGSESGISYIDVKISGTVTASRSFDLNFEQVGSIAALSGQTWTQSVYLRQVGGSQSNIAAIYLQANTYTAAIAYLTTPWLTAVTVGSGSLITQRFTAGNALTGATTAYIAPFLKISTATTGAVDFTIRIGLPQLEQGAFATSVIPTTTAAATRSADVASIGSSAFTSFYNQSEGTMFVEYNRPVAVTGLRSMAAISNGGFDNRTTFRADSGTLLVIFAVDSAAGQATFPLAVTSGVNNRAALAYQINNYNAAANGILGINDTVATVHAANQLSIGSVLNAEPSCSYIRRLCYWRQPLAGSTLQAITG